MSSPTTNPWFGVSMALVGLIVGYMLAIGTGSLQFGPAAPQIAQQPTIPSVPSVPTPPPPAGDVRPVDDAIDHIRGKKDALITIIEYSDYECPFCQRVHPTIQQVVDEYGDDVNWVYRHYPLSFHPNAQITAEASECVAELGDDEAFWAFTDIVMEKGALKDSLLSYATEAGVDGTEFQKCLDSGKYTEFVNGQLAEGSAAGVQGTPGNIVYNNKTKESLQVSGAQPVSAFKSAIDQLMGS